MIAPRLEFWHDNHDDTTKYKIHGDTYSYVCHTFCFLQYEVVVLLKSWQSLPGPSAPTKKWTEEADGIQQCSILVQIYDPYVCQSKYLAQSMEHDEHSYVRTSYIHTSLTTRNHRVCQEGREEGGRCKGPARRRRSWHKVEINMLCLLSHCCCCRTSVLIVVYDVVEKRGLKMYQSIRTYIQQLL